MNTMILNYAAILFTWKNLKTNCCELWIILQNLVGMSFRPEGEILVINRSDFSGEDSFEMTILRLIKMD